jgi:Flp pilus assembly protein TadB
MIAVWTGLKSFGSWVANNPAVQWVLGILAFLVALVLWGERREKQGRRQERVRQREVDVERKEEADISAREIIEEERTDADEAIDSGERAVRAEPFDLGSMSDEEWRLTFGRDREAGDPGYRGEG